MLVGRVARQHEPSCEVEYLYGGLERQMENIVAVDKSFCGRCLVYACHTGLHEGYHIAVGCVFHRRGILESVSATVTHIIGLAGFE